MSRHLPHPPPKDVAAIEQNQKYGLDRMSLSHPTWTKFGLRSSDSSAARSNSIRILQFDIDGRGPHLHRSPIFHGRIIEPPFQPQRAMPRSTATPTSPLPAAETVFRSILAVSGGVSVNAARAQGVFTATFVSPLVRRRDTPRFLLRAGCTSCALRAKGTPSRWGNNSGSRPLQVQFSGGKRFPRIHPPNAYPFTPPAINSGKRLQREIGVVRIEADDEQTMPVLFASYDQRAGGFFRGCQDRIVGLHFEHGRIGTLTSCVRTQRVTGCCEFHSRHDECEAADAGALRNQMELKAG